MHAFAFAAASLVLVVTVSASTLEEESDDLPVVHGYQQGEKCPAERFYDDCNYCFCSVDGYNAGCTRKACRPQQKVSTRSAQSKDYPHNDLFAETSECKPDQYFKWECNLCHCSPDGVTASCTDMACLPVKIPHIDGYQIGEKCVSGQTFMDDCNFCRCGSDGRSAMCTLMGCPRDQ